MTIVVIQCAATKDPAAGYLLSPDDRKVDFVADPLLAPRDSSRQYARPDDPSPTGATWRQVLSDYNENEKTNPLGLLPAYRLYANPVYAHLAARLGLNKFYILSAGWGLIAADFLTPHYDITFSQAADAYKRRRQRDLYNDFCMLPHDASDEVMFFGGKDYLPLFSVLTKSVQARKIVFYNSAKTPEAPGCVLRRYQTSTRTNWHYECAATFLAGNLSAASQ